jgi:hypothetical protein
MNKKQNPNCDGDHCKEEGGEIRRLTLCFGSGLMLCRDCFDYEMEYRKERNPELSKENQFELTFWESLTID